MDDGDFILGRLDRLEKRLEELKEFIKVTLVSLDRPRKQSILTDLGVSDSPDKPV